MYKYKPKKFKIRTIDDWLWSRGGRDYSDLRQDKDGRYYVVMSDFRSGEEVKMKIYLPPELVDN